MSIFATWLSIEDERQWVAGLEADGIKAGIIRDGGPDFDDFDAPNFDAPIIYQGSHVLPSEDDARGGSVDVAAIPAHVRFWRENPGAAVEDEPDFDQPPDPFVRLSVNDATVILTHRQVVRLHDCLAEWLASLSKEARS